MHSIHSIFERLTLNQIIIMFHKLEYINIKLLPWIYKVHKVISYNTINLKIILWITLK